MKYTIYSFIILLATLTACKKQPVPSDENKISLNKCQTFNEAEETITCCLDSVIEDSRCPVNAVCVWQGVGIVRFSISFQNKKQFITLSTFKFSTYDKETVIDGFKIELIQLSPVMDVNKQYDYNDYAAEVKITKM